MINRLKIVYFGSSGELSIRPFEALMQSQHNTVAVVLKACSLNSQSIDLISMDQQNNIESVAFRNNIQILKYNNDILSLSSTIESLSPDVIVSACISQKIPDAILSIPKIASINIHPSLLPRYRGPDPLFWQIRDSVKRTGVSIHLMNKYFDAGDIVSQQSVALDSVLTMAELKRKLSEVSSRLLLQTLQDIQNKMTRARPQEHEYCTYFSFPEIDDFEILNSWDAERVYYFMKATEDIASYFPIKIEGEEWRLTRAIDFSSQGSINKRIWQNRITFPCKTGYVEAEFLVL